MRVGDAEVVQTLHVPRHARIFLLAAGKQHRAGIADAREFPRRRLNQVLVLGRETATAQFTLLRLAPPASELADESECTMM